MRKRANPGITRHLSVVVIILQFLQVYLWGLDPQKKTAHYLVDQWEMADGIPSNTVLSLNQTPDGYLWIGTSRGLVRFDGVKFVIARFGEKNEIYSHETRCLTVDKEGILWIGSSGGLTSYRYRTGEFKTFSKDDGITPDGIRCIRDDMAGNLWIGFTSSYVNRYFAGRFTPFNAAQGLSGKKINAIMEDSKGNLLFGSREDGVFAYKGGKFSRFPVPGLDNALIITMFEDGAGDLWFGTDNGLSRVTGRGTVRYTTADGLTADYITHIAGDSDRNLWVGTIKGLNRVKKTPGGAIAVEAVLTSFPINCLLEDREKNLWVGTDSSGLLRLKDGTFTAYEPLEAYPGEVPLSQFEDRDGDTWIGTADGKLLRCQGSKVIETLAPAELAGTGIAAIAEDARGYLWLGTTGKGVFQKKDGTFVQLTTRDGLADNLVTSIFKDSRDNLWFGTFDGVSRLRPGSRGLESLESTDGLTGKVVHNVYESKAGDIRIAADQGITILKNGEFTGTAPVKYLQGIPVTCIHEDDASPGEPDDISWVATQGAGLKRLRDGKFFSYTTAEGMDSNFLYQFLEDRQGNFWFMSDSGILRVAKSQLEQLAGGEAVHIHCTSFGISDGMKSLEFDNVFSRNSALQAGNGEFRFITKKGIAVVNPEKIRLNKTPPPVVIEGVSLDGRLYTPHRAGGPVTFKGTAGISFHFTAPTFLSPGQVEFKYRLEGYDGEWIFAAPGRERAVHYRDLGPGTYTFRITACNSEGVWNQTGESLTFTLEPFFYQTLLFKAAVLFLSIVLAAAAFYIYKKKKPLLEKNEKYKGTPLNPDFAAECIKKLKYLVEVEKLYCDAGLTLQSLAEKMSINPHQLSQLLNETLDRNFADFINQYRIEEAKRILKRSKGAGQKIDVLAHVVGFNTMVAFYRAFRKYTGTTPNRYKKEAGPEK